jgi:anti-sigma B factor antagonist
VRGLLSEVRQLALRIVTRTAQIAPVLTQDDWGFAGFKTGKPSDEALHKACFPGTILPRQSDDWTFRTFREALLATNSVPNPRPTLAIEHNVSADGIPTLICRGRITIETSNVFKSEVKSLAPNNKSVLADMSAVTYVDSSGLGAVLGTYVSAKSAGCELKLVNVHPHVRDLLNLTHLTAVLGGK